MGNRKSEIPGTLELWNSGTLEPWNIGTLKSLQPANIDHNHMTGDWNSISYLHKAFLIG